MNKKIPTIHTKIKRNHIEWMIKNKGKLTIMIAIVSTKRTNVFFLQGIKRTELSFQIRVHDVL